MRPPAPLEPEQLAAYFALMEVSRLLQHAVERHLRVDGGISYVQFEILTRLTAAPAGEQRMTDLADGIVYSRSGLTYQVDQLEQAGLIRRAPSVEDERSVNVSITAAGRALVESRFNITAQVAGLELLYDRVREFRGPGGATDVSCADFAFFEYCH